MRVASGRKGDRCCRGCENGLVSQRIGVRAYCRHCRADSKYSWRSPFSVGSIAWNWQHARCTLCAVRTIGLVVCPRTSLAGKLANRLDRRPASRFEIYHSLKSPACSCVSIMFPAASYTRTTTRCERLEHVRYRQPSLHARSPAKIVGLDFTIRQIVSSIDFCVRPKTFPFAGDIKI